MARKLLNYNFIMNDLSIVTMELGEGLKPYSEIEINSEWYFVYPEGCPCNCWWTTKQPL